MAPKILGTENKGAMNRDSNVSAIEEALMRLRPVALSERTRARLADDLAAVRFPVACSRSAAWLRLAAAAILAVAGLAFLAWRVRSGSISAPVREAAVADAATATEIEPVAARTVLVERRDEGIVTGPDFAPVRMIRCDLVDHMEWRNRAGHERYIMTRPRKEMLFISCDTY